AARSMVEDAAKGMQLSAEKLVVLSSAYSMEGQMYVKLEQWTEAAARFEHTMELRQQALDRSPNDTAIMRLVMITASYLANVYKKSEGYQSPKVAVRYAQMAQISELIAAAEPNSNTAKVDLARSLYRQADLKRMLGQNAEGISIAERSLRV